MTTRIEKYIGKEAFENAVKQNSYNEECANEFMRFLDRSLTEMEEYNEFEDYDSIDAILSYPIDYANFYAQSRKEGFSIPWSKCYAHSKALDDTNNLLLRCYSDSNSENEEQAVNDLKTYCKSTNCSQLYTKYFIQRILDGNGYGDKPIDKIVEDFVEEYNAQIASGKSELYAYEYADLLTSDYHPIYCEDYASIYDESIKQGKSEAYAREYAEKYASELVDKKRRLGIGDDEDMIDFAKSKAKAYINAWEYAKDNNLKKAHQFIKCYEHAYLNTYYSDNPNEWSSIEECEQIVLEKALKAYEKKN